MSTDPKPAGEGDAICVQHIQIEEKLNYWTQIIWRWVKALYECQWLSYCHLRFAIGCYLVYIVP